MCGIIGITGTEPVSERILEALKKLEYRGYDSAGIATVDGGEIKRVRAQGKFVELDKKLKPHPLHGDCGIGHTRWATHGIPSEQNAHPHSTSRVALVHNGIIENHEELRRQLTAKGQVFKSDTDSEIITCLIDENLQRGKSPLEAVRMARKRLVGAYAIACIFQGHDDLLIVAREGASPLAIGHGDGENYVGSDALSLALFTSQISYLEEGDLAVLTSSSLEIFDGHDQPACRTVTKSQLDADSITKGGFSTFMEKEIHEQPQVVEATLRSFLKEDDSLKSSGIDWNKIDRVTFTACGTSFFAGMVAKYWFEKIAHIPCDVDIASEFRYRTPPLVKNGLCLIVSQSGETADTLAALDYAKSQNQTIVSIVNAKESAIERASDITLHTLAGPEIGVASTKAFTTQLAVLGYLVMEAACAKGSITNEEYTQYIQELLRTPSLMRVALGQDHAIQHLSQRLVTSRDALFLGRGVNYAMALEGALKLKEISYIHAEAYAAGEMKHGPIALLEEGYPVIVLAPSDEIIEKTVSNVHEAVARGGWIIALTDNVELFSNCDHILMPKTTPFQSPFVSAVLLQLLAYSTASQKGTDVDQPRNLAKSVTVE